jgi:phosphoribosylformimino-5-aminoimidazole carboxamide ribonucleotide (ProFAR) isomerase
VWLLLTLAVPTDEVLYGVFAAESPDLVQTACARAGAVPERMSVDVDARISQHV